MAICFPELKVQQLSTDKLSNSESKKPLGEILLEAGLVSIYQIEVALKEQKECDYKIGELLSFYGWLKQETADFFVEKWPSLLKKNQKRPVSYYLFAAGLLNKKQLQSLKHLQKQQNSGLRLHELAIKQGYLKEITIDFFLRYLLNLDNCQNQFIVNPYKLLKNYINGQTDFRGSKLSTISLNGARLKKVVFDGSIFRQANLNNSNLTGSSFASVNLTLANLESANLSQVNFQLACLIEANLRKCNLERANFEGANLQEADLRGANLANASFAFADLRGAKLHRSYSCDVYYDKQTMFDANFNPVKVGWKLISD